MKKKNTLRPQDISYEPIKEEKQPLWMHSMQTYRTNRITALQAALYVIIIMAIIFIYGVLC